jgi:hypothetical protein
MPSCKNTALRGIFGSKRWKGTEIWIKHYTVTNITRLIKARSVIWGTYVARMKEVRQAPEFQSENPERKIRYNLEELYVYGRIILKWILKKQHEDLSSINVV